MKSRGLVVGIAAVLTVAAAFFVFLYTNGVKHEAATGGALSPSSWRSKTSPRTQPSIR